jgi:hypothetical protein
VLSSNRVRVVWGFLGCGLAVLPSGCGLRSERNASSLEPSNSEVATSVVSGALNNTDGSSLALAAPAAPRSSALARFVSSLNPEGTAYAADWACNGGTLTPSFAGPAGDPYSYTPVSCSVTWGAGETASSVWSGPFSLVYGSNCDTTHPWFEHQAAGCTVTRTTAAGGDTRTITGPDGNKYAILHDTNGAGTGWDGAVNPAPSDGGVVVTCGSSGCEEARSLVIHGSHLTGTVVLDGTDYKIWDHTVSTSSEGLQVTGSGAGRVVNGSVTVQHNLLKYTSVTTFDAVGYGDMACCFPTAGSVSTTFSNGTSKDKTETLTFSPACGQATLQTANGATDAITLQHCL